MMAVDQCEIFAIFDISNCTFDFHESCLISE